MGEGSLARDYILTNLYENQKEVREAYGNVHNIIDKYVEDFFDDVYWMLKNVKNGVEMTDVLHHGYPAKIKER
jgi:hypothetical protein